MISVAPLDCRVLIGTVLRGSAASYFIQEVIGEGGQGWVFKASWDDAEGFPVVVKVLRPDASTRDAFDRFRREADILRQLSQSNPSPFIVRFYDHGEADFPLPLSQGAQDTARLPFTVMEYVHGESLYHVIERQRGRGLAVKRTRRILREMRKALEIVHAQGLIHRDLKPSNVLLATEAGREVAKVTDFGLVKVVDLRATATQSLAGVSLSYAPPEQYELGNPRVGPWTDVFSFAAIVYELLCGTEAFPANRANPFEALRNISTGKRKRLAEHPAALPLGLSDRPDLVARLDAILDHALAPEPSNRPQTLAALADAVEAVLREGDPKGVDVSGAQAVSAVREAPRAQVPSPAVPQVVPSPPMPPAIAISTPLPGPSPLLPRVDPADLRAWSVRVLVPGTPGAHVRDGAFDDEVRAALTLGNAGLVSWSMSGFRPIALPIGMSPHDLRGLARVGPRTHAVVGDGGVVAFLHDLATWDVRRYPDPDVVFEAIAADRSGHRCLAVGRRASRGTGIAAELTMAGWLRAFELPDLGPLRAAAWLDDRVAFACGDGGALVRIDDAGLVRVPWERSGHLRAIGATLHPTPAIYAVGTGGHALNVHPHGGRADIEKVNTTQDLLGVAIASDGAPWACSANARILRRDFAGAWRRLPIELPFRGNLLRTSMKLDRGLLLAEDASILEALCR